MQRHAPAAGDHSVLRCASQDGRSARAPATGSARSVRLQVGMARPKVRRSRRTVKGRRSKKSRRNFAWGPVRLLRAPTLRGSRSAAYGK